MFSNSVVRSSEVNVVYAPMRVLNSRACEVHIDENWSCVRKTIVWYTKQIYDRDFFFKLFRGSGATGFFSKGGRRPRNNEKTWKSLLSQCVRTILRYKKKNQKNCCARFRCGRQNAKSSSELLIHSDESDTITPSNASLNPNESLKSRKTYRHKIDRPVSSE